MRFPVGAFLKSSALAGKGLSLKKKIPMPFLFFNLAVCGKKMQKDIACSYTQQ